MTLSNIYQDHHKGKDQSVLPCSCCSGPVFVSNHPNKRYEGEKERWQFYPAVPTSLLTNQNFIGQDGSSIYVKLSGYVG